MEYYAGIDVSLELSSVCIVDAKGKIVKENKVESNPDALIAFLRGLIMPIDRIGLEAGPLSQWLHAGLTKAGFETVLLETRHVKAALSAMTVKTDRKDARGIAQLLRMGWFRPRGGCVGVRPARAGSACRPERRERKRREYRPSRPVRGTGLRVSDRERECGCHFAWNKGSDSILMKFRRQLGLFSHRESLPCASPSERRVWCRVGSLLKA
jgi:hypothetical protein